MWRSFVMEAGRSILADPSMLWGYPRAAPFSPIWAAEARSPRRLSTRRSMIVRRFIDPSETNVVGPPFWSGPPWSLVLGGVFLLAIGDGEHGRSARVASPRGRARPAPRRSVSAGSSRGLRAPLVTSHLAGAAATSSGGRCHPRGCRSRARRAGRRGSRRACTANAATPRAARVF